MKPFTCYLLAAAFAFLTSCAQLQHQTSESEPHALVIVDPKSELARSSIVAIDKMPIQPGNSYRLRPGKHTVEIEFTSTTTLHARNFGPTYGSPADLHINADGRASVSGIDPFAINQPVNFSMDDRSFQRKSIPIQVKAGKRYRISPNLMSPCTLVRD